MQRINLILIVILVAILCAIVFLQNYYKKEIKKEEVKIEFNENKIRENMKLFWAPMGWVIIYNNSTVYVPDENHIWELAKKGK
jgi:uncharacterized membrane protein